MRTLLMLLCLLVLTSGITGQNNFSLKWNNDVNILSGTDDYALDVVVDAAGNSYSAGVRGFRTVVRKYNSSGTLLWTNDFFLGSGSGYGIMEPVKIGVDGSGNVYVVTRGTQSSIMKRCVVKYNSAGTQLFANIFGTTLPLHTTDAWIDPNGVVYACGYLEGGSGANNAEVSKYSNTGTLTWQRTYDAASTIDDERAAALHVDASNNVYIAGQGLTGAVSGMIAIKYNSAGTQQWIYSFAQVYNAVARNTYGTAINTDASSNVYLAGHYVASATEEFYKVHKLSSTGALLWQTGGSTGYFASAKVRAHDLFINGTELQVLGQKLSPANTFTHQINTSTGSGLTPVSHNNLGGFYVNSLRKFVVNSSGAKTKSFVSCDVIKYWNGASWEDHLTPTTTYPTYHRAVIDNNNVIYAAGCKEVTTTDRSHYVAAWCLKPVISGLPSTINGCTYSTIQMPTATIPPGSTVQWTPTTNLSNPNIINPTIAPSATGTTYTLTVTNAAGCQNTQSIVVARIPDPSKNIRARNATAGSPWQVISSSCGCTTNDTYTINACPGDAIKLTGSSSNFIYYWYQNTTSNLIGSTTSLDSITVTTAGLYFAEVYYSPSHPNSTYATSGCAVTSFYVQVNMAAASINLGPDISICAGSNATITAPSGFTSYLWNTGATTQTIYPTAAGTYSVIGTYGSGCQASDAIVLTVNPLPSVELGPTVQSCVGNPVSLNAGAGFSSYSWNTGATTQIINVTSTGNYSVVVTDANGCQNSDLVFVQFNNAPNVIFTSNSNASICQGQQALLEFFGATSYNVMPGNINTTNSSVLVNPTSTTTYTLTGTDANGCVNTAQFTVTVNSAPSLGSNSTNATCAQSNGSASVNVISGNGPYTYLWNTGATTSTINNVASGSYTVTVTDALGCSANTTVAVNSTGGPAVNIAPSNVTCQGGSNGSATANPSGGTPPYSYLWSNAQTSQTATGLSAGTYTVTVTDNTGCQTAQVTTINFINSLPTIGITGNTTICSGQTTALTGTGGASYVWSTGSTSGSINVAPTSTTTYSVVGTASNGCQNSAQVQVTVNALPTITANTSTPSICQGSSATLTAGGGLSYVWSPGNLTGSSIVVTPTSAITYTVVGTGANGCQNSNQVTVNVTLPPTLQTSANAATCGQTNGTASVNVVSGTGPYTYSWSNGGTTANISNLASGNYAVVVTDGNGCTSNASANVNSVGGASVQVNTTNVTCQGGNNGSLTANATGGVGPYTYLWSNNQTTQIINNLTAGTYTVTVTDAVGCQTIEVNTISFDHTLPSISINGNASVCAGNTVSLSASGASTYAWSTGSTTASIVVAPTSTTTYSVTGTDANGCQNSAQLQVVVNPNPTVSGASTNATCGQPDGSATAIPSGGQAPYTFLWNTGATSSTINNVVANTYVVDVTDANGCVATTNVIVGNTNAASVSINTTNTSCESGSNGTAVAGVTGGTPPYSYLWSTGATTSSVNNIPAGVYSVTVTDAANCVTTQNATVNFTHFDPVVNLGADTIICQNTTITINAGSGFSAYMWSNNATTPTIAVNSSGIYSVTVTDNNGCLGSDSVEVTVEICTGITEQPSTVFTSTIYPNPIASGILNIEANTVMHSVEILDSKGSVVFSTTNVNANRTEVNVDGFAKGLYIIRVFNLENSSPAIARLIIQ